MLQPRSTPKVQPTPDYFLSLRSSGYGVHSAQGSFLPVLPSLADFNFSGTEVPSPVCPPAILILELPAA